MQSFFVQKKTVIIEAAVLVLFLLGMFYLYTLMKEGEATTTDASANQHLLGQNFVLFIKAMEQDKISFGTTDVVGSELVKKLRDYSQEIPSTESRGRDDPFLPYALIRPLR